MRAGHLDPLRVAPSLREARANDRIWLDRDGNVRPMTWLQRRRPWLLVTLLPLGLLACGALAAFANGFRVFGIVVGLLYLFVGAVAYWFVVTSGALDHAARGQSSEAGTIRVLAHPVMAAGFQRIARLIKARIAVKEQRWMDAVEEYRAIRYAQTPRSRRSSVLNRATEIAFYEEIIALCNADRRDDAENLLAHAPRPTGDFLELLYDRARLMVSFTADDPSLVPARDAEKMMQYERHATGWGVLALVGWHARRTGNEALACRAIDAEQRKPHGNFEQSMPAVARWLKRASES